MDIKKMIKDVAKAHGMDMCGFAGLEHFDESPPGRHPSETLPGCKSVVVIGTRLIDGVVQTNFRQYENGRHDLKGVYGTYGYATLPNFALTYACYAIAQAIERDTGATATPLSTGPLMNGTQISIRHSAVAAGLGEFGWMSIVLTPQFGPRNRFGVILTTAELEPDPLYSGPKLCDPTVCRICTDVCPTKAIGEYGSENIRSCKLGTYGKVSFPRCQVPTQALRREFGGDADWITTDDPTDADIADANARMPISEKGLQHHETWHCGLCLSYCPVGKWKEKFLDKALTGGASAVSLPKFDD